MAITIKTYADLQTELSAFVTANSLTPAQAPHGVFWDNLTYKQFVTGTMPGVPAFKIVTVGDASTSNLIMALSGTPGSPFDPNSGTIGQMPQPNPPYNAAVPTQTDLIAAISAWIDNGCPEH